MEKGQKHPHNNFFIRQFGSPQFALSFFQNYLPQEIKEQIEWNSFRAVPSDFVSKALKNRRSDIIYETRIKKQKCFFYLHLEHQRTSAPNMAFRMLFYWYSIMDQHCRSYPDQPLPLIFPMVLYQGKQPWSAIKNLHQYLKVPEFMRPYTPQFQYEVMDLSHLSDDQIQGELLVKASLLVMKHVDANRVEDVLNKRTLELFQELLQEKTGLEHIETILYYLFTVGRKLDKEKVVHMIQKLPEKPELKEVVMTLAEQWKAEGLEKGIEKGIKKGIERGRKEGIERGKKEGIEKGIETGRKKGQSQLVMKQLRFKFREQATPYLDHLEQASQKELELIAERILTISDINSVFEGIGG